MFFWSRGGKQFVDRYNDFPHSNEIKDMHDDAKEISESDELEDIRSVNARDFLDCLACLGEDKIKELIKNKE